MFLLHKLQNPVTSAHASSCYAFMYVIFIGPTILGNTPPHAMFGS